MTVKVVTKFNKLPTARAKLSGAAQDAAEKYLDEVDRLATSTVPVDTSKLKNSKERTKGRIAWTAEYAGFVNFGTYKMDAQPFASDAAMKALPQLQEALRQIEGRLLE